MAESGGRGCKKKGRAAKKPTHAHYNQNHTREKNKLKRVFKSNGKEAALAYAKKHLLSMTLVEKK